VSAGPLNYIHKGMKIRQVLRLMFHSFLFSANELNMFALAISNVPLALQSLLCALP
jgi:hypothetical protein